MNREKVKSLLFILLILSLFPISYFWRRSVSNDINKNSKYAIGKIIKLTPSLNSGEQFYFQFRYKDKIYENYRSSHVDYNVNIGDYFLINFSTANPEHSKILYEYKLRLEKLIYKDSCWDTIPYSILRSGLK